MDINSIPPLQAPQGTPNSSDRKQQQSTSTSSSDSSNYSLRTSVTDSVSVANNMPDKTLRLGQLAESGTSFALLTRETDRQLAVVSDRIVEMKNTLETITKNFPPFSPENQERLKLLMSYNSLRKELTKLMVPPPPPPVYEKVKGQWEDLFRGSSPVVSAVSPDLSNASSDPEIEATLNTLGGTQDRINSIRITIKQSLS